MKQSYKRIYAKIDLDALKFNANSIRKKLPLGTKLAVVLKADAYGHGAPAACYAIDDIADYYCTATADEAINLRLHNITKPILILGPIIGDEYKEVLENDIRATVFTLDQAVKLSDEALKLNKTAYIHIAVDTGMNRIGIEPDKCGLELVKKISSLSNISIEGVFSHLYKADEADLTSSKNQLKLFEEFLELLKKEDVDPPIKHISNSAGIMTTVGSSLNMVRAGIILYGIYPSDEVDKSKLDIKPVMSIKSQITYIKSVHKGEEISYGGIYTADTEKRVATIPVGYADGYPRDLSSKGYVLICGNRANILGRICMDQMMVDVTDISDAKIGTEVTLVGESGGSVIKVEELSSHSNRFPYEFICDISRRVPRVYYMDGREIGCKDYFEDIYKDFVL